MEYRTSTNGNITRLFTAAEVETVRSLEQIRTGFGQDISGSASFDEILTRTGTNWSVEKVPLFLQNGELVENAFAITRDLDGRVLCPNVAESYTPFQQEQFRNIAEGLLTLGARPVRGGSFYGGRKVWYQFQMPDQEIMGDDHHQYLYLTNAHDASASVMIMTALVRIVCSNALNMVMRQATCKWTYIHKGDLSIKVAEAEAAILHAGSYAQAYREEAESLRREAMSFDETRDFVDALFPYPTLPKGKILTERQIRGIHEKRERLLSIYDTKDDLRMIGDNKLKMLQAVADYVSHPVFKRKTEETEERYLDASMSGHPILAKAYNLLVA